MPPPRVRPATPVDPMKPDGVAMPNFTVAWSTSPQVQPASARTVRPAGSTVVLRNSDRSMTRAPSATPSPAPLWPPPRTAISAPWRAGEPDAADDVGAVPAARDRGRILVDHAVVHGARLVVTRISRHDQVTAHGGGQLVVGHGGDVG